MTHTALVSPTTPLPARKSPPDLDWPAAVLDRPLVDLAVRGQEELASADPTLQRLLVAELRRQQDTLMMVAASSPARTSVLAALASGLTSLTTEGYPGRRFHAGCTVADRVERLAILRAQQAFGAHYVNVQPHSGSSANLAVLTALLQPGDVLLGLELDCGGHLTHGSPASLSGRLFRSVGYGLDAAGRIDLEEVARLAHQHHPKVIVCGASAYPRVIDFAAFRRIADEVGAVLLADISHISGLVAAGLHPNPVGQAHVVTTSTYKQLYGPRGGLIMSGVEADQPSPVGKGTLAAALQRAVFPASQGTPDLGSVAAKARALDYVTTPEFRGVATLLRDDARAIADRFTAAGLEVVTGGTDTHMVLVDLRPLGLTGDVVEESLERCRIVVNRNRVPGDRTPVRVTGGLRIGTNTLAARGMGTEEAVRCADLVLGVVQRLHRHEVDPAQERRTADEALELCRAYPLP